MLNRSYVRLIFILQLFAGAGMIVMGLMVSARPYMLLDVVLGPAELADPKIRDATLTLLQRGSAGDAAMWMGLGVLLFVANATGLRLTPAAEETQ